MRTVRHLVAVAACTALLAACSVRKLAVNALAKSLAASGDVYASDEDPELVRDATPFALKTMEALLAEQPEHPDLLLAACGGFTQYAYAFVETEAERLEEVDFLAAEAQRARALALYLRARGYCLRALELVVPGIGARLVRDPSAVAGLFDVAEVPLLYWTGASWGAAMAAGKDRPELVADLPVVRSLLERALALDAGWERGVIHEALIGVESLPEMLGGSPERARYHFAEAERMAAGRRASVFVMYARSVLVPAQDVAGFRQALEAALEVDVDAEPGLRLANVIAQRQAHRLQERIEDLFVVVE